MFATHCGLGFKPKQPGSAEGVGLEETEDDQADHGAQHQVAERLEQKALALGGLERYEGQSHARRQHDRHRGGVQLGSHGAAQGKSKGDAHPEQGVARKIAQELPDPRAGEGRRRRLTLDGGLSGFLDRRCWPAHQGYPHGKIDRQVGEHADEGVHGEEVRLLDHEHHHRRERRRQDTHPPVVLAGGDGVNQQHRQQVCQGGKRSPDIRHLVEARMPIDPFHCEARQEHGQRAVNVKAVAAVDRVEGRFGCVEVLAKAHPGLLVWGAGVDGQVGVQALERGDIRAHPHQEALVGVQVLVFAPVDADKTEIRPHQEHTKQEKVEDPGLEAGLLQRLRIQGSFTHREAGMSTSKVDLRRCICYTSFT